MGGHDGHRKLVRHNCQLDVMENYRLRRVVGLVSLSPPSFWMSRNALFRCVTSRETAAKETSRSHPLD